ncbi:MAG: homoserine dehydrogenase [Pseudomonadota bacterium]
MKPLRVGIIGFGTVGGGTLSVLQRNQEEIQRRLGRPIVVTDVANRRIEKINVLKNEGIRIHSDALAVARHPDVDVVIEVMGGTTLAKEVVLTAIAEGKSVVTANKALLALHGQEIFNAAKQAGVHIGFEAAVAGGIPILKVLREGLTANRIEWLAGIINGTSNFILSEMRSKGLDFATVLAEAQRLGYAEADPTFDVEGIDAAHKLSLLSAMAFGSPIQFDKIHTEGIRALQSVDIRYAESLGYRVKLLGLTRRTPKGIELRVHPALVPANCLLAQVDGAKNAILVQGDAVGPTLYVGAGAGAEPTASAVVADIIDIGRYLSEAPHKAPTAAPLAFNEQKEVAVLPMSEVETSFYLRFPVTDRPGVVAELSRILAEHNVSLSALLQKPGQESGGIVDIIVLTHCVKESAVHAALAEIEDLAAVHQPVIRLHVETLGG